MTGADISQYERPEYFWNISDPDQNMEKAKWLKDHFDPTPRLVLDLGAGKFTLIEAWRKLGVMGWGVDWSWTGCKFSPDCAVRAIVQSLPFRSKMFDVVTAFDVLEHLPSEELTETIREIHRVVRGFVMANIPLGEQDPTDKHHLTIRDRMFWETMFRECFEILSLPGMPPTFNQSSCLFLLKPLPAASALEVRL